MAEIDPRWAWEPYKPSAQSPWDIRKVGHLARRAGFGATWEELEAGLKAGPEKAIDQLLQAIRGKTALIFRETTWPRTPPNTTMINNCGRGGFTGCSIRRIRSARS